MKKLYVTFVLFFLIINSSAQQRCFDHSKSLKQLYVDIYEKEQFLEFKLQHIHEKIKTGELIKSDSINYANKVMNTEVGFIYHPQSKIYKSDLKKILKTDDGRIYKLANKEELSGFLSCLDDNGSEAEKSLKKPITYDVEHRVSSSYQLKNGNFMVIHSRHAGYLNKIREFVVYKIQEDGAIQIVKTVTLSIS